MPTLPKYYNTGTASVANGSTALTGTGTSWANIVKADDRLTVQGLSVRIASVEGNGAATLAEVWSGTSLVDAPYEIAITYDGPEFQLRVRELLEDMAVVEANGRGLFYLFDSGTTDADPGDGELRFNNATVASATACYIDNLDANGATVSGELDTWDDADATTKGRLWVRSIANPSTFYSFSVTGTVVDGTGYRKLTLTYVGGSGALTAADELMVFFAPRGNDGTDAILGEWEGDWQTTTAYQVRDLARVPGVGVYICTEAHTSGVFATDLAAGKWELSLADGADGSDPGILLTWDVLNTDADPGPGKIRADNDDLSLATTLYIDKANRAGSDIEALLLALDDSTATVKGILTITDPATDDQAGWNVTGITDATGYVKVAISSHFGDAAIADTTPVSMQFARTGNDGVHPGFHLTFDDGTADSDPGAGNFRLNNADHTLATAAYVDNVEALAGGSITTWLDSFDDGNSTIKGELAIIVNNNGAIFRTYNVTGSVVDGTGYRKLTLEYVASAGSLTDGDLCVMEFIPRGEPGIQPGYRLVFDDTITDADPGTGLIRFDHATFGSITEVYVDNADQGAADITGWLDSLDDVVNANARAYLRFQSALDPTVYAEFAVTGTVTDGTGYRKIQVSPIAGAVPADATLLIATAAKSGADGAGVGDVTGPASSTADAIALFNGTGGKTIKDSGIGIVDEDDMSSDSATKIPTQQSVKAYVDANASGVPNRLINGNGAIYQRPVAATADDTYCFDRHYALTQTGTITPSQLSDVADGLPHMMRLTQSQASAQRMGIAQIIESANCKDLRGSAVTLLGKLRCSSSQAIRFAILEWTGTANAVTSDVVNDWTSGAFTAGNFFNSTTLTVTAVGTITPSADTVTDFLLTTTLGSSVNNVIAVFWTEGTAAQNVTLDLAWEFVQGDQTGKTYPLDVRPRQLERQLCYYHCYQSWGDGAPSINGQPFVGEVMANTLFAAVGVGSFPMPMFATPTVTLFDDSGTSGTASQPGVANGLAATVANMGRAGFNAINKSSGSFTVDQPVRAGFRAEAEL